MTTTGVDFGTSGPGRWKNGLPMAFHQQFPSAPRSLARPARLVIGLVTSVAAAAALVATTVPPSAAAETSGTTAARRIVGYTVRPGDTATGLAVRFHAWTDELIRLNHLGPDAALFVGDRIRIPIVVRRVSTGSTTHHSSTHSSAHSSAHASTHHSASSHGTRSWRDPSRSTMRRLIIATAHRHDVDPYLALAISWQEAGWQMHHTSSAGAIGAMQVIPDTGTWMSWYAGRRLNLRSPRDNVTAGVLLIRVLRDMTHSQKAQIAAYYQGIGSVQRGVLLPETRHYVRNVKAIKRALHHGWNPA